MLIWAITVAVQYTKIMYPPNVCTVPMYVLPGRMNRPDLCRQETKFGVQFRHFSVHEALVNA